MKRKYLSLARVAMQNSVARRGAFLVNMAAGLIYVVAMFYLWRAIFANRDQLAGYTWEEMKAYLLVAFLANTLLSWYSETRIAGQVLDGSVAMDLLKPLDFQTARLAETIGISVFEGGITALMASSALLLFGGVMLPPSLAMDVLFLISLAASLLIKFGVVYLSGLLCFWTSSAIGIVWARAAITSLLSGALVPLAFFPRWLEVLALALPFQGIVATPAAIYLGRVQGAAALQLVGLQLVWVVVLWFAGRLLWRWGVRQVTVYGG